jgi:hypothetical protein
MLLRYRFAQTVLCSRLAVSPEMQIFASLDVLLTYLDFVRSLNTGQED